MFGIGEFARLSRLSPKALRRYDELGLLPPDRVDPWTGYRWYAATQLAQARLVAELRQIGMPLADIKAVLSPGAGGIAAGLVEGWWTDAEADFAARRELARFLIDRFNGKRSAMYEIKTRSVPARKVLSLLRHVHWAEYPAVSREFFDAVRESGVPAPDGPSQAPFIVFHGDVTEDSDGPVEWCRPVPASFAGLDLPGLALRTEPAHVEAYAHLARDPARTPPAQSMLVYEALLAWAADQHRRPVGSVRQVFSGPFPVVPGTGLECDFAMPLAAPAAVTVTGSVYSDGCSLYYERRGEGPGLLLITGGGGDCACYSAMADKLASSYTVVSYDRRGNSRSTLSGPAQAMSVRQQGDDALAVLGACGLSSAAVFGNSGGATIALDLAARYPSAFPVVVAHEPPLPRLLPSGTLLGEFEEILQVLAADGWRVAFTEFMQRTGGLNGDQIAFLLDPPPGPDADMMTRISRNWEYLITRELRAFIDYQPDFEAIRAGGSRVLPAAGTDADPSARQMAEAVASALGSSLVPFPGGHTAPEMIPDAFAARLRELLAGLA
ncbi:MAG TPA: alpha/beta fold hydrolase [Streptosporangiaceae bacterium]